MTDPFDLKGQAERQLQALQDYEKTGEGIEEEDSDWHLPWLLNEEAAQLSYHFRELCDGRNCFPRSPENRKELEVQRFHYFQLAFEHLVEKYTVARRTRALLHKIERGSTGFVLFLRGFAYRAKYFAGISILHAADVSETNERGRIIQKLGRVPLVWVSNPVESGPLGVNILGPQGFRIDMGKNWEKEIRDLITTASFIFIYNPQMTPGIVREIKLIKESGCQGRAFYSSPENAQQVIKTGDIHRLTDSVVERARAMTSACHLKRGILPAPTFLWIKGKRRVNIESDTRQIMERLFELNKTNIAIGADDYLDMLFHLLSGSIVIEDFELLAIVLVLICGTFASIGEKHLPSQADFANRYALYANAFYASVKQTSQSLQPIDRGVRIFRQFKRLQRQNPDTKDLDSSPKHHSFSDKK